MPLWRLGGLCLPFPHLGEMPAPPRALQAVPASSGFGVKYNHSMGLSSISLSKPASCAGLSLQGVSAHPGAGQKCRVPGPRTAGPQRALQVGPGPLWTETPHTHTQTHTQTHTHTQRQWPRWPFIYTPDARLRASTGAKCTMQRPSERPLDGGPWWPCHGLQSPLVSPSLPLPEASLHRLPLLH